MPFFCFGNLFRLTTCETVGILSSAAAAVASLQVADALKVLSGALERVEARLFSVDVWENRAHTLRVGGPAAGCQVCVGRQFRHLAGYLYLRQNPGGHEVVRRLLGHRSITTTVQFYAGMETTAAIAEYERTVLRLTTGAEGAPT